MIWLTICLHMAAWALQVIVNDLIDDLFAYGSFAGDC